MRKLKALGTFVVLLSGVFVLGNAQAQEVRNVISSCHVETTAGITDRGRCKIKTWIEADYIIVEIKSSWEKEATYFKLVNNPNCKTWSHYNDSGCQGASGDGQSWDEETGGLVSIGENEDAQGNPKFQYSYGSAYTLIYDGKFPRPVSSTTKVNNKTSNQR